MITAETTPRILEPPGERRRNWNNDWKSNEVVVRIREKYRVAGPRLARPRRLGSFPAGHLHWWNASPRNFRLTKIHRFVRIPAARKDVALSDQNNVIPLAVKLTVVDLLPASWNVTISQLSYRSTLRIGMNRSFCAMIVFLLLRVFSSLLLKRKLERVLE